MARPLGIADPPSPASVGSPGIAGGPESQQIADRTDSRWLRDRRSRHYLLLH
ncbi:hypothetical protein ACMD2_10733 [Ananas comosus]|uniref:Uncharacterized protein n=1 Tax=Ananas comosus TaxID=4615 RepID=A0A199UJN7_ANACO|nr:hypothetical protein ACMD2_10733 [Ananas comosus]